MTMPTRRQFLGSAVAAGAGSALAAGTASAIEPVRRNGKAHIRLSIAAYSYRKYLALNIKPKPPMTLDDFVETAADMGLDAVEPTAYYFAEKTPDYLAHLKGKCTRLGLDVSGTAVGNNFCVRDPDKLREQIAYVKEWVDITARLGGKTIRIFAGNPARGDPEEQARARFLEGYFETVDASLLPAGSAAIERLLAVFEL